MSSTPAHEKLGEPALRVDGFRLWIHGYQYPDASDFWDGNWLRATVHCAAKGAGVTVEGAILMNVDLARFADECEGLRERDRELAILAPLEPELKVTIRPIDKVGHFVVQVGITPDHMTQSHTFDFEIDQTHLPGIAQACRGVIMKYPIRGRT